MKKRFMRRHLFVLLSVFIFIPLLLGSALSAVTKTEASKDSNKRPFEELYNHINYFRLSLNSPLANDVSVNYTTRDGSAIAGKDYISTSGIATISAGKTEVLIGVEIISDQQAEVEENFYLVISQANQAAFSNGATEIIAEHIIIDGDGNLPTITLNGDNPAEVMQGQRYQDTGANALDVQNTSIIVNTQGVVDTSQIGSYTLRYSATDSKGNTAIAERIVNVIAPNNVDAVTSLNNTRISLHATLHHVGVQIDFSGDINANASATLEANINNAGFQAIHRLSRVANNRFVGTVFSVPEKSAVQVRVSLLDPDGVDNTVLSDSITTRSEQVPQSSGQTLHVSVNQGDDSTGDGSLEKPYASIAAALEFLKAGTTVFIHAGTYHEQLDIPYGSRGKADNPITLRSAGDGEVILDGISATLKNASEWNDEGNGIYSTAVEQTYFVGVHGRRLWRYDNFTHFEALSLNTEGGFYVDEDIKKLYVKLPNNASPQQHEIQVSTLNYGLQLNKVAYLVIDGLTFSGYGSGQFSKAISIAEQSEEIWIVNSRFEHMSTAIWFEGYSEDITIMNNDFSDEGVNDFDWEQVKESQWWLERGAVFCSNDDYSGRGIIFYKNTVHDMFDGLKITGHDLQSYANNSDVEANTFRHLSDDGVETDGWSSNVRVVNNHFENLLSGISVAPALGGPTYIIGNVIADLNNVAGTSYETVAVKFNVSDEPPSGEVFVYHNTATTKEANQAAFSVTNSTDSQGIFLKNNIWMGTAYSLYYWLENEVPFNEDYDLHFATGDNIVLFQGDEYKNLSNYAARYNLCQHCKMADPLFKDSTSNDCQLSASSPARNQAVRILGINDNFIGSAPDIGALEYKE